MKKFEIIVEDGVAWGPISKSFTWDGADTPMLKGIESFNDKYGRHFIFNVDDDILLDGLSFINANIFNEEQKL